MRNLTRAPVLLILLLLENPGFAGVPLRPAPAVSLTTGGVRGRLIDGNGKPVPGVQVDCIREDGIVFRILTDTEGSFRAGGLPPGNYVVAGMQEGYRTFRIQALRVKANCWLLPPRWWDWCGTGREASREINFDRGSIAGPIYELPIGTAILSREDLQRLPLP